MNKLLKIVFTILVTFTATHFAFADASGLISKYNKPECKIGYSVGSSGMYLVEKYFDKAQKIPLESIPTAHSALISSKINAFVQSRATMQYAITSGLKSVYVADCNIGEPSNICIGISPKSKLNDLKEELDNFIKNLQEKGILQKIIDKWLNEPYAKMPDLPEPTNPERTLIVGTTGTLPPFSFYSDNILTGLDIELIKRFAYYYNAKITYKIYDFNGIVSAAEAGAIDCIATHLMETEERKKAINFSIPYFKEYNGFMIKTESESELNSFQQLEKMRIAVIGTTVSKELILQKAPNAKNFCNYSSNIDGIEAVKSKKADCYVDDEPILRLLASRNKGIKVAPLIISKFKYGIALKKNNPLTEKITRIVEKFREQGILDELKEIWTGKDESKKTIKTIPNQTWEGKNGTLKYYCEGLAEPLCYYSENQNIIGYDVHLVHLIAKELDMKVKMTCINYDGMLPALQSGKADIVAACLTITEERLKSVDMVPYYDSSLAVAVRDETSKDDSTFIQNLNDSFNKTFVVENRWKMVVSGLWVTILISIASGIFGFIFGFFIMLLNRQNYRALSWLINASISIVSGIPAVVFLMILYYVIFGSIDISPTFVSIVAFTITFGSSCYELINNGIQAVPIGQEEAAKALGYSNFQTFCKILFPQAARQFLPLMKGEFIAMVKMTSIVGYVSCIDLTKASDLIRARTMEAFFPLIATAIVYYIVSNLMILALNKFEISLDPKRRERKIAGVKEMLCAESNQN